MIFHNSPSDGRRFCSGWISASRSSPSCGSSCLAARRRSESLDILILTLTLISTVQSLECELPVLRLNPIAGRTSHTKRSVHKASRSSRLVRVPANPTTASGRGAPSIPTTMASMSWVRKRTDAMSQKISTSENYTEALSPGQTERR